GKNARGIEPTPHRWRRPVAVGAFVIALVAIGISSPGRVVLNKILSRGEPAGTQTVQPGLDLEQQVRARHGWGSSLRKPVITGVVTFYDSEGQTTGQSNFTLTRKYPGSLRVDLSKGGTVESAGFDGSQPWKGRSRNPNELDARDIRAWLR